MFVAVLFIVIAALLLTYAVFNIWVTLWSEKEDLWVLSPISAILALNFGAAGGFGLGNLNIFSGKFGDIANQNLLALANLGSSFLYGFSFLIAILAFTAIYCIISAIGSALS